MYRHCFILAISLPNRIRIMRDTMPNSLSTVRVAAIQAEPIVLDREATVEKACQLIAEAAAAGAKLIVFPELFIPTYVNSAVWGRGLAKFGAPSGKRAWARLWNNSVEIPSVTTEALAQAASNAKATVIIGLNERTTRTNTLYNTLLFIGPDGRLLGKHRKLVPTSHERMIHGYGDGSTLQVFDTPVGKIGGLICAENWMPLARYALYSMGEQIHVAPNADDREIFLINVRHTALEAGIFVISVCMLLRKSSYPADFELSQELAEAPELLLKGGSVIISPDGEFLAGPLWNEEGILYADLDLNKIIEEHQIMDVTGHYARPDILSLRFDDSPQNIVETIKVPSKEQDSNKD
jgi:nitrilase